MCACVTLKEQVWEIYGNKYNMDQGNFSRVILGFVMFFEINDLMFIS